MLRLHISGWTELVWSPSHLARELGRALHRSSRLHTITHSPTSTYRTLYKPREYVYPLSNCLPLNPPHAVLTIKFRLYTQMHRFEKEKENQNATLTLIREAPSQRVKRAYKEYKSIRKIQKNTKKRGASLPSSLSHHLTHPTTRFRTHRIPSSTSHALHHTQCTPIQNHKNS